jgi:putative FmdB family regulatory protein
MHDDRRNRHLDNGERTRNIRIKRLGSRSMPIYEYQCEKCRKLTSVLTTRVSKKIDAVCTYCGGKKMRRLMSRFAMPRSDESRMDSLADPSKLRDLDENDPRSVARMMKRMGTEMGEEFSGPEFDEAVNELESTGDLSGGDDPGDDDL